MDRRDALKNLTMSLGYVVAAPTIFNMLASCTSETTSWKPLFLSNSEKFMVTNLVDVIIPKTEIPGALDVNVPQFLDLMYNDIELAWKKEAFRTGAKAFQNKFETTFKKNVLKGNKEEFTELLGSFFNLSEEASKKVLKEQKLKESELFENRKENYQIYKFLISVRYYTIFGYCTSEKIGEEVLNYDPVPGVYQGCIPLEDVGNAWSL